MPPRPISARQHGLIDYATGVELLMLPSILGITGSRSSRVLRAAGLSHLTYSAMTDYDFGLAKRLPFKAHLAIDAVAAGGLLAAPWVLGTRREGARHWLPQVIVGLNEALVTALTDPRGADVAATSGREPAETTPAHGAPRGETSTGSEPAGDLSLSPPDPKAAVMPDGVEANEDIGARTIGVPGGRSGREGGAGSGAGAGSDPPVDGQQT